MCKQLIAFLLLLGAVLNAEPNRGGTIDYSTFDAKESLKRFQVPEGFEVQLAADSKKLGIANPLAINFDNKGRLWVLCWPDYPQMKAGKGTMDTLYVLEDIDGDGIMDKKSLFADDLHAPTGFEFGDGGVYVAEPPFLTFIKDTDGDGKADFRQKVLHGFGTEDSHHTISAFHWGPGGGLYFGEGNFHHTRVETPYGPVRVNNGAFYRFEPESGKLEDIVNYGNWNPWGQIFDKWGQHFIADASPGMNYYATALSGKVNFPAKHSRTKVFTSRVRPTAGVEIISSRNFPDEYQGNFIIANCIGFHGIKMHKFKDEGAGFGSDQMPDLLKSTDPNFRPVDLKFAPDGSLYICDWFNPLIGHMQYAFSDKRRDSQNGRIWRLVNTKKPLVPKAKIADASIEELFENLKLYEDKSRYNTRRELRERPREEVLSKLKKWFAKQDKKSAAYEHLELEVLWLYQSLKQPNIPLLKKVLKSKSYQARAAAARVMRYWKNDIPDYLRQQSFLVQDFHPRVRLQAVINLSFENDVNAVKTTLSTRVAEYDYYLNYVIKETILTLEPVWRKNGHYFSKKEKNVLYGLLSDDALKDMPEDKEVLEQIVLRVGLKKEIRLSSLEKLANMNKHSLSKEIANMLKGPNKLKASQFLTSLNKELLKELSPVLKASLSVEVNTDILAALIKADEFDAVKKYSVKDVLTAFKNLENTDFNQYEAYFVSVLNKKKEAGFALEVLSSQKNVHTTLLNAGAGLLNDSQLKWSAASFLLNQDLTKLNEEDKKRMALVLAKTINEASREIREKKYFNSSFYLAKKLEKVLTDSSKDLLKQALNSASKDIIEDIHPKKYEWGRHVYEKACIKCHQSNGQGLTGAFPPLADSDWLKRSDEDLIKIVLHGLMGPVTVNGVEYNSVMAPVGNMLKDGEVAAAITYIKNTWGNRGRDISPSKVTDVRKKYGQRGLWTVKELEEVK